MNDLYFFKYAGKFNFSLNGLNQLLRYAHFSIALSPSALFSQLLDGS